MRSTALLTLALCASLTGCAHFPGPGTPTVEMKSTRPGGNLGHVAVSFASVTTQVNLGGKPVTKTKAAGAGAREAGAGTFSTLQAGGGYGTLFGLLLAPVAAAGAGAYGTIAGVSSNELEVANRTLEAARTRIHPELEITARLDRALGRDCDTGSAAHSTAPESCDTRLMLQFLDCRLTDGRGVNPGKSLRLRLRADLVRTKDGTNAGTAYVQFESEGHRYTEWAANDAQFLHAEWQRALSSVAQQLADWMAGQSVPPTLRPDSK